MKKESHFKKVSHCFAFAFQAFAICAVVFFALNPVSCKMTEEGIRFLHGDFSAPTLDSFSQTDEKSISVDFSKSVKVRSLIISEKKDEIDFFEKEAFAFPDAQVNPETGKTVLISLKEKLEVGKEYELYGEVLDENGNSLTFCIPIVGFNDRVPNLVVSAVHPMYASPSGAKNEAKCEFVELYALTSGNLAGVKIESATYGEEKSFTLPALEVREGEKIVVHLRTKGENCISELGTNLSLSSGWYCYSTHRDIWSSNEKKCLSDKEDVILVTNSFTKKIIDGLPFKLNKNDEWAKESTKIVAQKLVDEGIWEDGECAISQGLTATKILQRNVSTVKNSSSRIIQSAKDWTVEKVNAN